MKTPGRTAGQRKLKITGVRKGSQAKEYEWQEAWYTISGSKFYPSRLHFRGKVAMIRSNDPGELVQRGLNKNRFVLSPFGHCSVKCTIKGRGKIAYLADHLHKNRPKLRKHHGGRVVFWILFRGVQGNMEFTVQELAKLAKIKVPLAIDYVQMDSYVV
jgi:hypothetical protein